MRRVGAEEAHAICALRGCIAAHFTIDVLDIVAIGGDRRRAVEVRETAGLPWSVVDLLKACRRAKGLKVPSAKPPEGLKLDENLDEAGIAKALAADGVVVYAGGKRTNSLQWVLRDADARVKDPQRIIDPLVLCGLALPRKGAAHRADFANAAFLAMKKKDDDAIAAIAAKES